jgi:hypothetical protein
MPSDMTIFYAISGRGGLLSPENTSPYPRVAILCCQFRKDVDNTATVYIVLCHYTERNRRMIINRPLHNNQQDKVSYALKGNSNKN